MDLKTEKSFALTNDTGIANSAVAWTPDETKLLFLSSRDRKALFAVDMNGTIEKVIQFPGISHSLILD